MGRGGTDLDQGVYPGIFIEGGQLSLVRDMHSSWCLSRFRSTPQILLHLGTISIRSLASQIM